MIRQDSKLVTHTWSTRDTLKSSVFFIIIKVMKRIDRDKGEEDGEATFDH